MDWINLASPTALQLYIIKNYKSQLIKSDISFLSEMYLNVFDEGTYSEEKEDFVVHSNKAKADALFKILSAMQINESDILPKLKHTISGPLLQILLARIDKIDLSSFEFLKDSYNPIAVYTDKPCTVVNPPELLDVRSSFNIIFTNKNAFYTYCNKMKEQLSEYISASGQIWIQFDNCIIPDYYNTIKTIFDPTIVKTIRFEKDESVVYNHWFMDQFYVGHPTGPIQKLDLSNPQGNLKLEFSVDTSADTW